MLDTITLPADAFNLKYVHLRLIAALLRFANADRQAWPSLRTLGELLQLDPTYVRRQLLQMELLGYLAIDRSGKSNRYTLAERFFPAQQPRADRGLQESTERTPSLMANTESLCRERRGKNKSGESPGTARRDRAKTAWLQKLDEFVRVAAPEEFERHQALRFSDTCEARAYRNNLDRRMRESGWHRERQNRVDRWCRRRGIPLAPRRELVTSKPVPGVDLPPDELQQRIAFVAGHFVAEEAQAIILLLMEGDGRTIERIDRLRRGERGAA